MRLIISCGYVIGDGQSNASKSHAAYKRKKSKLGQLYSHILSRFFLMQQEVARGSILFINGKSYRYEYPDFVIRVEKRSTHVARLWFTDLAGMRNIGLSSFCLFCYDYD